MSLARLAGLVWRGANLPGYWSYRAALADPRAAQDRLLRRYLGDNADTAFGRAHGFSAVRSVEEYQDRVPASGYADHDPWIQRIVQGERSVLTRASVRALQSTGGSTRAKLIPYTATLQCELRRAVAPWIVDLCRRHPAVARGRGYWAITPVTQTAAATQGGIRVGFEEDAEYLGGLWRRLVDTTLAVPGAVRLAPDIESFRYLTLLFLLAAEDLTLVSVWHPSFLTLLLDALPLHWDALLASIRNGRLYPPGGLPGRLQALARWVRPRPWRAAELQAHGPHDAARLWPRLALVSCWGEGHAALYLEELRRRLPDVEVQPKGLLATEACVTIPFEGSSPLAVRSHFFEFLESDGRPRLAHQLEPGGSYSVVVTTGGGLYRYHLEDRVACSGFLRATPTLRFLGKEGHISDICGEKLREEFVAAALADVFHAVRLAPGFALLAPDHERGRSAYTLYLEAEGPVPDELSAVLEAALAAHGDYRYAVALGQLAPARVFRIASGGLPAYLRRSQDRGQRLGDVKPLALSPVSGWSEVFAGRYEPRGRDPQAARPEGASAARTPRPFDRPPTSMRQLDRIRFGGWWRPSLTRRRTVCN